MKNYLLRLFIMTIILNSCNPFPGPRKVDWKEEWKKNQTQLKDLANDILTQGNKKYTTGINSFSSDFDYPFDDGFGISRTYSSDDVDTIDTKNIVITFYVDRGLLDHYSAIIFTNDTTQIEEFERNVGNGGNDFKIEPNWYMIND